MDACLYYPCRDSGVGTVTCTDIDNGPLSGQGRTCTCDEGRVYSSLWGCVGESSALADELCMSQLLVMAASHAGSQSPSTLLHAASAAAACHVHAPHCCCCCLQILMAVASILATARASARSSAQMWQVSSNRMTQDKAMLHTTCPAVPPASSSIRSSVLSLTCYFCVVLCAAGGPDSIEGRTCTCDGDNTYSETAGCICESPAPPTCHHLLPGLLLITSLQCYVALLGSSCQLHSV